MKKVRLKEVMSFVPNDTAMRWQGVDSNPGVRPPEPPFLRVCALGLKHWASPVWSVPHGRYSSMMGGSS